MKLLSSDFDFHQTRGHRNKGDKDFDANFIVGIEVEAENVTIAHPHPEGWNHHNDGSLRNHGMEYISVPIGGSAINKYIASFYDNIPEKWSFSQRTSTHVHVNIQDFSYDELGRLLFVYCACEPILFDFVGEDRANSSFCTPLLQSYYPNHLIHQIVRGGAAGAGGGGTAIQRWEKYSAVNLSRCHDLGTIEFRHMHGTRDKIKMLLWLKILQGMYRFARKHSIDEMYDIFRKADANFIIQAIWSDEVQAVFQNKEVRKLFRVGLHGAIAAIRGDEITQSLLKKKSANSNYSKFIKR